MEQQGQWKEKEREIMWHSVVSARKRNLMAQQDWWKENGRDAKWPSKVSKRKC